VQRCLSRLLPAGAPLNLRLVDTYIKARLQDKRKGLS
jgi:hypothetical protein